jgi:hypothetical protein
MNSSIGNSQNSYYGNTEKSLKFNKIDKNERSLSQTLKVQLIEKLENENLLIK